MSDLSANFQNSGSGKVENGVWYLDYTSWNPSAIPAGVNTVNLFVSEIVSDGHGGYTIGGLNGYKNNPQALKDFIAECHKRGIEVKISIGGQGGQYDNCWNILNGSNATQVAQGLVNFCNQYGLDGVDFDYEENQNPPPHVNITQQEKEVGELIKAFKTQAPNLSASLCTCAGDSWQSAAKNIFDQTLDANGHSLIDHLYIMSYSGTTEQVEKWADEWNQFIQEYKLPPSAVTIGIAEGSASPSYDVDAIAEYAGSKGYSTMIWNYNPALSSKEQDAFDERIEQDYQRGAHHTIALR